MGTEPKTQKAAQCRRRAGCQLWKINGADKNRKNPLDVTDLFEAFMKIK